jgi:hypothetical protein
LKTVKHLDVLLQTNIKNDSINLFSQSLMVIAEFVPQSNTYESLKTSGQMEIISDFSLKNQIHDVYLNYNSIKQYDSVYRDFHNQFVQPFFVKNLDFRNFDITCSDVLNDFQFTNLIQGYLITVSQKVDGYRVALQKSRLLKQALDSY